MRAILAVIVALAGAGSANHQRGSRPAATFYVTPTGAPSGAGTAGRPWDLATALAGAGGRIQPGDTVLLGGGRYRGRFQTTLRGTPTRHIVFRQRPEARATIDGTLRAEGA